MKIKRIKKLKVLSFSFDIKWDKSNDGGMFDYNDRIISIGVKSNDDSEALMILIHELTEICAIEMGVRFRRPDVNDDYMFVYDHRQHGTMTTMLASLLEQFIV